MSTTTDRLTARFERPLLYVMSGIYIAAGVMHFVAPRVFARIVPPRFPRPVVLVYLSGVAEIGLGIGVLFRRTRRRCAWGIVLLLLAVFPANVHMATSDMIPASAPDWATDVARVGLWARLPFQGVLMLWAWLVHARENEVGGDSVVHLRPRSCSHLFQALWRLGCSRRSLFRG